MSAIPADRFFLIMERIVRTAERIHKGGGIPVAVSSPFFQELCEQLMTEYPGLTVRDVLHMVATASLKSVEKLA